MANKLSPVAHETAVCSALILHHDPAGLRRRHIDDYKHQVNALERSNSVLKNLEENDIPRYRLWLASEFAAQQTAMMTLQVKFQDLEMLCSAAEDYRSMTRTTFAQAYSRVSEAHANGTLSEVMEQLIAETEDDYEDDIDDRKEDFFDGLFEDDDEEDFGFSPGRSDHDNEAHDPAIKRQQPDGHFKSLYRQLVRKLHPDFCPNQSPEERSMWHELQDAYEWNDLSRLEQLFKRIEGVSAKSLDLWAIPIAQIVQMTAAASEKLRRALERIAQEKRADYWDFTKRQLRQKSLSKLSNKMRGLLENEIQSTEHLIASLELDIQRRCTPRKRRGANASSKSKLKKNIENFDGTSPDR